MNSDAILIDDDILVQMAWKIAAKRAGRSLSVFTHPDEFLAIEAQFSRETPIYVDSNLGDGLRGEQLAAEFSKRGFKEIWLCTGHSSADFPQMPWIRGIRGKDAPWL